ncbi:MAG TPA: hypothetical protein VIJ39_15700 [Solirubrobacteraceae bacterium]
MLDSFSNAGGISSIPTNKCTDSSWSMRRIVKPTTASSTINVAR